MKRKTSRPSSLSIIFRAILGFAFVFVTLTAVVALSLMAPGGGPDFRLVTREDPRDLGDEPFVELEAGEDNIKTKVRVPPGGTAFTFVYSPYAEQDAVESRLVALSIDRASKFFADKTGMTVQVIAAKTTKGSILGAAGNVVVARGAESATLGRTFGDFFGDARKPGVPFVSDIVSAATRLGRGKFVVVANPDIVLKRNFFVRVFELLQKRPSGRQAITVNRRTVERASVGLGDGENSVDLAELLERVSAQQGKSHPGHDCFAFPVKWAAEVANAMEGFVVGSPVWGCWLRKFICEKQDDSANATAAIDVDAEESIGCTQTSEFITMHLGNEVAWRANSLPWVWNAMWLQEMASRLPQFSDSLSAVRHCRSKNPCTDESRRILSLSPRFSEFSEILERGCKQFSMIR